ncbi:MAG: alcohol dehydrogenase catalytic domain-containing protein, partial [Desulfovibrionaceae bacterium]|nr:alcohol dehydrogenase catalytic domain-containing protein [Desulfovibrionaceae bacterium]
MRAVVFKDRSASLAIRPKPEPGPGEALLRVRLAGICNTDLELLAGCYGFQGVPGHEFVALVNTQQEVAQESGKLLFIS